MKKIISLLCALILIVSCTKQKYYDIPLNPDGTVYLTGISSATTTGISTLDDAFSVTATFATAKTGDVMNVELLQLQEVTGQASKQLLPMAGTQKTVTVGSDMKGTVSYTRAESKLTKASEYVTVVYNGLTDYAKIRVDMVPATAVTKPKVSGKEIDVARTAETAYFNATVVPKSSAYTGNLVAKRKNGTSGAWVDVAGSPFSGTQPFLVPISGTDFAAGKDTMFYTFTAASGTYTDVIKSTVIVRDPYFYLKKTATLTLGGTEAGRNLLINAAVAENNTTAQIGVSGSLMFKGGSSWLALGNTIEFVPSTAVLYGANNSSTAIADFNAGAKTTTADPAAGEGVYIFKIKNGTNASDIYYGMIKVTNIIPNTSVTFEYRIGDQYAHLTVIQ